MQVAGSGVVQAVLSCRRCRAGGGVVQVAARLRYEARGGSAPLVSCQQTFVGLGTPGIGVRCKAGTTPGHVRELDRALARCCSHPGRHNLRVSSVKAEVQV